MKLYLSRADTLEDLSILRQFGCKYYHISCRYFLSRPKLLQKEIKKIFATHDYLVDSGVLSYKRLALTKHDLFFKDYLDFIDSNELTNYSEYDAPNRTDLRRYRKEMLDNGLKPMLNIREADITLADETVKLALEHNLKLGIGTNVDPAWIRDIFYFRYRNEFIDNNLLVHTWSRTGKERLNCMPFYSGSTGSWAYGQKKGMTFHFTNRRLKFYEAIAKETIRNSLAREVEKLGLDVDLFLKDDPYEVSKWNCKQYIEYQKHLTRPQKGEYWLKGDAALVEKDKKKADKLATNIIKATDNSIAVNSKELPVISGSSEAFTYTRKCDYCDFANMCNLFRAGSDCRLHDIKAINNAGDILNTLKVMLAAHSDRVAFALAVEKMTGGVLNEDVTKAIEQMFTWTEKLKNITDNTEEITVKAKGKSAISVGAMIMDSLSSKCSSRELLKTVVKQQNDIGIEQDNRQAVDENEIRDVTTSTNDIIEAEYTKINEEDK